jgi:hypothetical protein
LRDAGYVEGRDIVVEWRLAEGDYNRVPEGPVKPQTRTIGRKIAEVPWTVYATRAYVERHGRPERTQDLNQHLVVAFDGEIANHAAARWLRSSRPLRSADI